MEVTLTYLNETIPLAVVIGKTDIPVERVIKMSDKELNELVDKLLSK